MTAKTYFSNLKRELRHPLKGVLSPFNLFTATMFGLIGWSLTTHYWWIGAAAFVVVAVAVPYLLLRGGVSRVRR